MESHVKERLTGALILVALLVIVVPEMLSGPKRPESATAAAPTDGPPLRTYTMELGAPGNGTVADQSALAPQTGTAAQVAATAAQSRTPASESEAPARPVEAAAPAESAPAASPATPAVPAATPPSSPPATTSPAPSRPAVAPAAAPTPGASPGAAWWVQIGSFSQAANAQRLVKQLGAAGYPAQMGTVRSGNKELFRVRAGPVADRAAAEALRNRLAAAGHKGSLVAP